MTSRLRILMGATIVALTAVSSWAQSATDPSGHWEGAITAPFGEIPIAVDVTRRDGQLIATFSRGDGSVTGFPLSDIELSGTELKMTLKVTGGGIMRGSIAGTQMSGTFAAFAGTAPFVLTRTGEARFAAPPTSAAVSKALEGTWTARIAAGADSTTFHMTLANRGDGTAIATVADDNGVAVPLKVTEEGTKVTLEIPSARGTFTGALTANGTAIEGTYVEGALNAPVTFVRER